MRLRRQTARADQVQPSPLRWVALWSPLETRSLRPFWPDVRQPTMLGCTGEPAVPLSYGGGRLRAWHTGTTSTTFCRSDDLKHLGISTDISLNAARQVTVDAGLSKTDWGSRVPGCVGLAPRTGCNFRASWTPAGALERVEPPAGQVADELLALLDRHGPVRDLAPRGPAGVPGVSTAGVGVVGRVTELVEVVVGYPAGGD